MEINAGLLALIWLLAALIALVQWVINRRHEAANQSDQDTDVS